MYQFVGCHSERGEESQIICFDPYPAWSAMFRFAQHDRRIASGDFECSKTLSRSALGVAKLNSMENGISFEQYIKRQHDAISSHGI
jgi:hypothetical protein